MDKPGDEITVVSGQVRIAPSVLPLAGATVHVYLEETSAADAPANGLAEVQLPLRRHPVHPESGWSILAFTIRLNRAVGSVDSAARYTVRVWVDADSDGHVGPHDLFSDQAYPVLTHGFGNRVDIVLT